MIAQINARVPLVLKLNFVVVRVEGNNSHLSRRTHTSLTSIPAEGAIDDILIQCNVPIEKAIEIAYTAFTSREIFLIAQIVNRKFEIIATFS